MNDLLTVVFWNVRGSHLAEEIGRLADMEQADIVVIAENGADPVDVESQLRTCTRRRFGFSPKSGSMLDVFSTYPGVTLTLIEEGARFSGQRLTLGPGREIGMFALHLPSKLHRDSDDQQLATLTTLDSLRHFEERLGHRRTVVIGDFNMDPFEKSMAGAMGFHAVLDRVVASQGARTVQGKAYPFFYNPMWSLMGDCSTDPPGSYYYNSGKVVTRFWHMFDQVLIRPPLVNALVVNRLRIVDRIGERSLLDKHIPDRKSFSDHLPLSVSLSKSKVPQ